MFLKMHENWKVASAVKHIDTNQVSMCSVEVPKKSGEKQTKKKRMLLVHVGVGLSQTPCTDSFLIFPLSPEEKDGV